MASLRLKFPEKEEPSVIVLSGARVTLGRLPLNTIQIIDRTLSGFHAEFVQEEDHYRLHDRGSTNGTFVNGESVTDFHLREACKVSFGALECEYSPEAPAAAEGANVEALPTRSEVNTVRQENAEFKNRVESLREELDALTKARSAETGTNTVAVAQEEYDKLVAEREALKESQHALQQEIVRLKTDLALLQRDRENLKKVAASAQAEFANFRAEPAAEAPAPVEEKIEASKVEAAPVPPSPVTPAPAVLPKPSFPLPAAAKLAPKPPGSLPGMPAKLPAPMGSGLRPAAIATPTAKPVVEPTAVSSPKPPMRLPTAPLPKPKGGTQRIDLDAAIPSKPVVPAAKVPLKPPMKLPLQPTVRLQSPRTPAPAQNGAKGSAESTAEEG
jgi:pSer/pThr/pTyr-binding forkhead associated (FHA) protein